MSISFERPKILVVDDTPANVEYAIEALETLDAELLVANSGEAALKLIDSNTPTLILLDVMMPGLDGFETCRRIRQSSVSADIPVIFLTANADDLVKGFESGGNDYVIKPFNHSELIARVKHELERLMLTKKLQKANETLELKVREKTIALLESNRRLRSEINERRYMQDRLQFIAERDPLSGTYNRSKLENQLDIVIAKVHRITSPAVFMLFDIVNFKLINEVCGYVAGDHLLRHVGDAIGAQLEEGIVARISSDKFGILLEVDTKLAIELADRLVDAIKQAPFDYDGRNFTLAALIGVVPINQDVSCSEQVFLAANHLITSAKEKALEDQVLVNTEALDSLMSANQKSIAREIIDAIEHDALLVFGQCIHPLGEFKIYKGGIKQIKIELLVRHRLKNGTLLSPEIFIPLAERLKMVAKIDKFVIKQCCAFMRDNPELLKQVASFNINLSALTLRQNDIAKYIIDCIDSHHVPADKIEFEITESQSIVDLESTVNFMNVLKAVGCKFALDDFGTGFASYSHLQELPFDTIKIDGIFVRNLNHSDFNRALIESIVNFAHNFQIDVVGEHVETAELAHALIELGCTWAQGYVFHAPEALTIANVEKQLEELNTH